MDQTKSNSAVQIAQSSAHSKDAGRGDRINPRMVVNVLLIWLDASINENNSDFRNIVNDLEDEVHTLNFFADAEERIDFLGDIEDEKTCMAISSALSQRIILLCIISLKCTPSLTFVRLKSIMKDGSETTE